jgi:hypothetical protein
MKYERALAVEVFTRALWACRGLAFASATVASMACSAGVALGGCGGSFAPVEGTEGGQDQHSPPADAGRDAPKDKDSEADSRSNEDAPSDTSSHDTANDAPADAPRDSPSDTATDAPACDAVTGHAYFVDPMRGSNGTGTTGSNMAGGATSGSCAFKTIGHAIEVVGASPPAGTTITLLSDDSTAINGEAFPLVIPTNTIVQGATASVTISVSGSTTTTADGGSTTTPHDGFHLASPASGLKSLTLNGALAAVAARGINAGTGSSATTTVGDITIHGFPDAGILIQGSGVLSIGAGTVSSSNLYGLHVTSSGVASVTGSSSARTAFSTNKIGILVDSLGSITVDGTAGTDGSGTVVANGNTGTAAEGDGVLFDPTPNGAGTFPAQSVVTGLVVWSSGSNGIHIYGGAKVKVRSSYILNNGLSGIRVETNPAACATGATSCTRNDYTYVDLGTSTTTLSDWGLNSVQDVATGYPNKTVGVCFLPTAPTTGTISLFAEGNIFGTVNCSTTAGALTHQAACTTTSADDVGGISTTILVDTSMCTN